jgi:magnesium chelatase subunit D
MTQTTCSSWQDAALVAALFAVDPAGLGGVVVRGGPGPAVDRWLQTAGSI